MLEHQGYMRNSQDLKVELDECRDEGKDITGLAQEIEDILAMEGRQKEEAAGAFLDRTLQLPVKGPWAEPSELEGIRQEADGIADKKFEGDLFDRVYGGWLGRCCGCLLGKPFEGWKQAKIHDFLKKQGNFLPEYFARAEGMEAWFAQNGEESRCWIEKCDGMPEDDDTNYTLIGLKLLKTFGRDFTSENVCEMWLNDLPYFHLFTAERVAYRNMVNLVEPPRSGSYRNVYREWIGAQIRGDFFGYINPGRMEKAAEMAHRDASISHVKNGIYGEMWASATLAAAFVEHDPKEAILAGLATVPEKSRLHKAVLDRIADFEAGMGWEEALADLHRRWNEGNSHHWCHTISNAEICTIALLNGVGDLGKTIGIATVAGFDTDCNAATTGSIVGVMKGAVALPKSWTEALHDTLHSGVDGYNCVKISQMAKETMAFIR